MDQEIAGELAGYWESVVGNHLCPANFGSEVICCWSRILIPVVYGLSCYVSKFTL